MTSGKGSQGETVRSFDLARTVLGGTACYRTEHKSRYFAIVSDEGAFEQWRELVAAIDYRGTVLTDIYRMTVDLNVLDHLGINLYSNIAAVLTEAVANAWDAHAETVDIRIDPGGSWIEIVDDGIGMSVDDMNGKYLRVGYRTNAGKHIIVELKKVERKMKLLDLQDQGQTYVDKLKKILLKQSVATPNIEVVFVIGKPVDEEYSNPERLKSSMAAIAPGSRIVHYDSLIRGAQEAYSAYIEKSRALDKLEKIVDRI